MLEVADCVVVSHQNDVVSTADGRAVIFKVEETHQSYILGDVQALPTDCESPTAESGWLLASRTSSSSRNSDGFPASTFRNIVPQKCALLLSHHAKFNGLPLGLVLLDVSNVIKVGDALNGCMIEKKLLALIVRLAPPLP